MKKFLSLLLTAVLCCSLGITAFAAEGDYTFTVQAEGSPAVGDTITVTLELSKNEYICKKDEVIFKKTKPSAAAVIEETPFEKGILRLSAEKTLLVELLPQEIFKNSYKIKKYSLKEAFDYDTIQNVAFIRSRKEGDRADIHGGTKTLKKLFNEEKIPPELRDGVAVVADSAGVVWVEGLGAARRARLADSTKTVAVVKRHAPQESSSEE